MRPIHVLAPLAILFAALASAVPVEARIRLLDRAELISLASAIAVVRVDSVDGCSVRGDHFTYSEAAVATVVERVKGELPERVTIHAGEDFICASTSYNAGKTYLVFLRRDGDLYTTLGYFQGAREVSAAGAVGWFAGDGAIGAAEKPLADVVAEIRAR